MCSDPNCDPDYCKLGHLCKKGLSCNKKSKGKKGCFCYHICDEGSQCVSERSECKKLHPLLRPKSMKHELKEKNKDSKDE